MPSVRSECEAAAEALVMPLLDERGWELVDVEYVKQGNTWYLRVYIDKQGGITVDDCEAISKALEKSLDRDDFIPGPYVLEVSSPGLGRALKKERDYARNRGKEIEVNLYKAIDGGREFRGILKDWTDKTITIITSDNRELIFEKTDTSAVREAYDW